MNKVLYIMCGPAGGGKSTYIRQHAKPGASAHISRDAIRFAMVHEDEYYFSRETEVYHEFCEEINDALQCPWVEEVYADATHLTEKARNLLLNTVKYDEDVEIVPVVVKPALKIALEQNAQRTGRECVPERVIRNMYKSFEHPLQDDLNYEMIIENDKVVYKKVEN